MTAEQTPDIEAIAEVLAQHLWKHTRDTHCSCGFRTPLAQLALDGYLNHVAAALAPVLAAAVREARAAELRELADELAWTRPDTCPCDEPENCCGSAESCDAMQPVVRVVGAKTLRDRADRIAVDAPEGDA